MAVRIPVVISQNERRSGSFVDIEEKWITSLLFEERLDATLIEDLKHVQLDSTDHLCLEGIKGDFVLLAWGSPQYASQELMRVGMGQVHVVPMDGSERIVTSHTFNATQPASKRVYFLALSLEESVEVGLGKLRQLLASLSTPVFKLQRAPKASTAGKPTTSLALQVGDELRDSGAKAESISGPSGIVRESSRDKTAFTTSVHANQDISTVVPEETMDLEETGAARASDSNKEEEFPNIERWMQQLDDFE